MCWNLWFALLFVCLWLPVHTFSQGQSKFSFVENKGQWADSILYKVELPGGRLSVAKTGLLYTYIALNDLHSINEKIEHNDSLEGVKIGIHNYRVDFVGASEEFVYTASNPRNHYLNYFYGNDPTKWRGKIGIFEKITMQGLYDGIDMEMYSKGQSLKYDFVVAAGANPQLIKMKFDGVTPVIASDGTLVIQTSVNEVIEGAPYSYQIIAGQQVTVDCLFKLENNQISFEFPQGYNTQFPLVIDPELIFTTFSGGGDFQNGYFAYCTTYDNAGSLYTAGVPLWGLWPYPPTWPTTPGAFQPEYTSIYGPMVCINKYNSNGTDLAFSTYYGGSGPNDIPHSMIVNPSNELILAGSTGSFDLPVTEGCYDSIKGPGTDIFVAHFTGDGSALVGATYVGGNVGNSINGIDLFSTTGLTSQNKTSPIEMTLDSLGNIWMVSNASTIDFPVTSNASQSAFGGGNADAVLFALNAQCTDLVYSSYLGGSNTDVAYGIKINNSGEVVVCGGTKSIDFPTNTNAYLPTAPGSGDWDGFVAIVNTATGALEKATYLGTDKDDQATHVQLDAAGNIFVLGRTFGAYPITNGVFHVPAADLFVDKLPPDLSSSLRSTRLGNPQASTTPFFPTGFLVDNCMNTYVTGLSGNYLVPLANMPLTNDAFQSSVGNFWFGVLTPNFLDLKFGTYYGRVHDSLNGINGDHIHTGVNRLDPKGILYQSLCVNSLTYPGTNTDSWSETNQNTVGQDIVSFKFAFNLAGVSSSFNLGSGQETEGCAPFTVQVENTSTLAANFFWDFGDGSPLVYNQANPSHTYIDSGVYTITLVAQNDTACITSDTSFATITVYNPQPPVVLVADTLVCDYQESIPLTVMVNNPSAFNLFKWEPSTGVIGPDDNATVFVNPNLNQVYTVTVWDTIPGLCGYRVTDTITIDYRPRSLDIINNDTLVCVGTTVDVLAVGTLGYDYQWSPHWAVASPNQLNTSINADSTMNFVLTGSYPGCADTSQTLTIAVDQHSPSSFVMDVDSVCVGEFVQFTPTVDSTSVQLNWDFGDGSYLNTVDAQSLQHAYDMDGLMEVSLITQHRACLEDTFALKLFVGSPPHVDLGLDTALCLDGRPIVLQNKFPSSSVSQRFLWNTGDTTAAIRVVNPGTYRVTVSNEPLDCTTVEEIIVSKDCYIDIPNAFTPNHDGDNDYFLPRNLLSRSVERFEMEIFNRWGQVVFQTNRVDGRGWDGRFNSQSQPIGVYLYRIDVTYKNGRSEHYEGNVTLVR